MEPGRYGIQKVDATVIYIGQRKIEALQKISSAGIGNCIKYLESQKGYRKSITGRDIQILKYLANGETYFDLSIKYELTHQAIRNVLRKWEKVAEKVLEEKHGQNAYFKKRSC